MNVGTRFAYSGGLTPRTRCYFDKARAGNEQPATGRGLPACGDQDDVQGKEYQWVDSSSSPPQSGRSRV
ncbi:MAG TPA: hypothetical protein VGF24_28775 [Vicinamibacterales bacterium]